MPAGRERQVRPSAGEDVSAAVFLGPAQGPDARGYNLDARNEVVYPLVSDSRGIEPVLRGIPAGIHRNGGIADAEEHSAGLQVTDPDLYGPDTGQLEITFLRIPEGIAVPRSFRGIRCPKRRAVLLRAEHLREVVLLPDRVGHRIADRRMPQDHDNAAVIFR